MRKTGTIQAGKEGKRQVAETAFMTVGEGAQSRSIAYRNRKGDDAAKGGVVWLGGYRSDMAGTKAEALDHWAAKTGHQCLRHDYSGHGESGGEFRDGTISRWLEESIAVFDAHAEGPQILVGSSMGGWIALRMAQELKRQGRQDRLKAMVLIAPAPDFTHELMWPSLSDDHKRQLEEKGYMEEPSEYSDEPNIFTRALFEDGERNRVMTGLIETGCPVHILQGMRDPDVPWQHAMKLAEFLPMENVTMTLVKDGDHRLSREEDIALLIRTVEQFA